MWKKCEDWMELPEGDWLVKIDDERKPYHVANVFMNSQGDKIIIAGGCFYFDMGKLLAYTDFEKYNQP